VSWMGCPPTPPWALMYLAVASNAFPSLMSPGPAFVSSTPILIGVPLGCAAPAEPAENANPAPLSVSTQSRLVNLAHQPP
jgi:hypothetical protein